MKTSARNAIKGRIVEIDTGPIAARIVLDIGNADRVTSLTAAAAVKDMNLKIGDLVTALIESRDVTIAK